MKRISTHRIEDSVNTARIQGQAASLAPCPVTACCSGGAAQDHHELLAELDRSIWPDCED